MGDMVGHRNRSGCGLQVLGCFDHNHLQTAVAQAYAETVLCWSLKEAHLPVEVEQEAWACSGGPVDCNPLQPHFLSAMRIRTWPMTV